MKKYFHKKKRGALQISFGLLFAIIVGAVILFIAILATTKFVNTERTSQDAKTSAEIGNLINPLETGFEEGKTVSITMPVETRIYAKCVDDQGVFGKQQIRVSQKSFNTWSDTNMDVSFENKYIFAEDYVEGETFYLFSKPFEFPFKVTDLIYITSSEDNYCFTGAPREVEDELEDLNQGNFFVDDCPSSNYIKVCFSGSSCDIYVNYNSGYVSKDDEKFYFENDALMYAAIFSSKDVYECQIQRLMNRVQELALIYADKENSLNTLGCGGNLRSNLIQFISMVEDVEDSSDLGSLSESIQTMIYENKYAECKLW